ncbi:FAS1-like dehydratase domain-containing protein [Gordonia polyisoprenivorans]|uniref:FAS1-like dehydratase domain-containing protein n=1 Tax=Gordonia polyisoprenivorans TaxID=84595 RepID=UPI001AD639B7|nr:MaoC family dehydratase N-terminal domain-containing protein [Gordonia polyisoprenivorans]QTI70954.1 MaoC family dehydratase N-terminal domain-containing protein [Gordonia polyisoprenivorans]
MAVERFPVEAGHVSMLRRALGHDDAERDADTSSALSVPATFVQASAQFDPTYLLRPTPDEECFGSGAGHGFKASCGNGLYAEQHYEFRQPVRVGMVLPATSRDGRTGEKVGRAGTLHFSELITEYVEESGAPVVSSTSVGVGTVAMGGNQ